MAQRLLYPARKTKWREHKKRQRKAKKPYYARRIAQKKLLEDPAMQNLKALEGVYDVVVVDPPWPVAFQGRDVRPDQVTLAYPTMPVEVIAQLEIPVSPRHHFVDTSAE